MIENGVDSLKIEGRMKSVHYVSTVTNCYKAAVDAYLESPEKFETIKQDLIDEMWKVAQRELATGFYYSPPSENEQLFGARRKIPEYKFIGEVVAFDKDTMTATIRQRNVINEGDQVEFYGPGFRHFELEPDFFMMMIIAPLMFFEGSKISLKSVRKNIKGIFFLSITLAIITVLLVAFLTSHIMNSWIFALAICFAAIVTPTDSAAVIQKRSATIPVSRFRVCPSSIVVDFRQNHCQVGMGEFIKMTFSLLLMFVEH